MISFSKNLKSNFDDFDLTVMAWVPSNGVEDKL